MWPARATVGRQPSRCVFGMNPWRDFLWLPIPTVFASTRTDCLPTVEHAVLASWFRQQTPAAAARIKFDDALAQLGFEKRCEPYSQTAAAVAHVVLEAIEDRLPVWACWKDDNLIQAAGIASRIRSRNGRQRFSRVELFAINWASSGPGFDWPVHYNLVWTPIYDRFVVTASADCPDAFGYADFALGHFGRNDNVGQSVIEIIKRDWTMQTVQCSQQRWEGLTSAGLIKEDAVEQLADQVWPQYHDDDDLAEDDPDGEDGTATLSR